MLPIAWNEEMNQWEVKDQMGKVLWRGVKYSDAAQFAEDYEQQQKNAAQRVGQVLNVGAVRD